MKIKFFAMCISAAIAVLLMWFMALFEWWSVNGIIVSLVFFGTAFWLYALGGFARCTLEVRIAAGIIVVSIIGGVFLAGWWILLLACMVGVPAIKPNVKR